MSFTSIVKTEVSKLDTIETENIAELSAIIRNSIYIENCIRVSTENASVARRIFQLIKNTYDITPKITVRKGYAYHKNYLYLLEVTNQRENILNDLSIDYQMDNVPKPYLIDDEDSLRAYLRGLFLSCGSINDPKTSRYHLEFLVGDEKYANFVSHLLNQYDLNSKVLKRENKYMVYMKEAEKIGDFLRVIQASEAVLYYEDIRIYRDHKNMTNRLNNCEQANVDRIIETADHQVYDIELIKSMGGLELLEEKEQVVAFYRLKYKDASLLELAQIITLETGIPISKSGLHHRFNKIKRLATKMREGNNII